MVRQKCSGIRRSYLVRLSSVGTALTPGFSPSCNALGEVAFVWLFGDDQQNVHQYGRDRLGANGSCSNSFSLLMAG